MDQIFNFSTAYVILALMFLVMPTATWLTLLSLKSRTVALWCFSGLLFGIGLLLLGLRANLPEWATYPLANFFICFSGFMMVRALSLELKKDFAWHWIFFLSLIGLFVFETLRSSPHMQTYRFAWGLWMPTVTFVGVAWYAFKLSQIEKSPSALWIAGVFSLAILGMLYRIVRLLWVQSPWADALLPNMDGTITIVTGLMAAIFGNMGYIGLYLERAHRLDKEVAIDQERRMASQRLGTEIANLDRQRSMSEMSAALAHELSQPLTAANVDLHVIEVELHQLKPLSAKLEEAVLDLQKHMVRSIQIVTRIHDFIKSREPLMEPVRWHDIYQDVIHLLPQTERPAGSRIEWISKAHQSSTWVMGDSIQLSQVLLNLLRNALQAQHVDRLLRLKVLEYVEGMSVSLSISDNGTGMDEATIESALTAFFSTKNDGLGVGLAISKSIMEQHGGSLSIESVLGQGTQITLTLPQLKTT
ncbi:MAG: ATP-binding protein [Betaproteobacteria bacterium]